MNRSAFVAGSFTALLGAAALDSPRRVLVGNDGWLFAAWESLSITNEDGIATTVALLARTAGILGARGIQLTIALVPFKARYYERKLPANAMSAAVRTRYARCIAMLTAAGIRAVNLQAPLAAVANQYFRTDQHWTSESAGAAGAAVAKTLSSAPARARPDQPSFSIARMGDLAALLLEDERRKMQPELFRYRMPYDADLAGYDFDTGETTPKNTDAIVDVIGNSFVRPMFGFPQMLSRALGAPVRTTFLAGSAGPYHTLLMGLTGQRDRRKPRSIVWQMGESNFGDGPNAAGIWDTQMSPDEFLQRVDALCA